MKKLLLSKQNTFTRKSIIIILALVLFAITFQNFFLTYHRTAVKLYLFHLLVWPLFLIYWLRGERRGGKEELLVGGFLFINVIMSFFSAYGIYTIGTLINYFLYAAWFLLVRDTFRKAGDRRYLFVSFYWITVFLSLAGLGYRYGGPFFGIEQEYRMRVPVSDPNSFAAVLIPGLLIGVCLLMEHIKTRNRRKILYTAGSLLIIFAAFMACRSKGATFGLLTGVVFTAFYFVHYNSPLNKRRILAGMAIAGLVVVSIAAVYGYFHFGGTFVVRKLCWKAGLAMLYKHPFGSGPGNALPLIPLFLDPVAKVTSYFGDFVSHVHNEYLEVAAETGVAGLVLFVLLIFYVIRSYITDFRDKRYIGAAAGAGFVGICVTMISGVGMRFWTVPIVFWLLAAAAPFPARPSKKSSSILLRYAGTAVIALMLIMSYYLVFQSCLSERALAWSFSGSINREERITFLKKAKNNILIFRDTLLASWILMDTMSTDTDDRNIEDILQEALFLNANHAGYAGSNYYAGRCYFAKKEYTESLESGIKAFRFNPFSAGIRHFVAQSVVKYCGIERIDTRDEIKQKCARVRKIGVNENEEVFFRGLVFFLLDRSKEAVDTLMLVKDEGYLAPIASLVISEIRGMKMDDIQGGLHLVKKYLEQYPGDKHGRTVITDLLKKGIETAVLKGQHNEALDLLDLYIDTKPKDTWALHKRDELLKAWGSKEGE